MKLSPIVFRAYWNENEIFGGNGMSFTEMSLKQLLGVYADLSKELRERGVSRSENNPTGDFAEYLFCHAFGWRQEANSKQGYDATGVDGVRYQIKARRSHLHNKSRQLSAIRDLTGAHFDILAGVIFTERFEVFRGALIPRSIVEHRSTYRQHTNSNVFLLNNDVWEIPGVQDVTDELRAALP